jgi:hypothetical protein
MRAEVKTEKTPDGHVDMPSDVLGNAEFEKPDSRF